MQKIILPPSRSFLRLALLCAISCPLAAQDWSTLNPAVSPAERASALMVYDTVRKTALLYGGTNWTGFLEDTWTFDGQTWKQASSLTSTPGPKYQPSMCFDEGRGVAVQFGGSDTRTPAVFATNETWEWNGSAWLARSFSVAPSPRRDAAIAYDSARRRVVLFGGTALIRDATGSRQVRLRDTWEYDGVAWRQVVTKSAPGTGFTSLMTFDAARARAVLIETGFAETSIRTWEYDGKDWTLVTVDAPPGGRAGAGFAYDSTRKRTVLTGGASRSVGNLSDTWEYDGRQWYRYELLSGDRPRNGVGLCDFPPAGGVLAFGYTEFSRFVRETRSFGGRKASVALYGKSCLSLSGFLEIEATTRPVLGTSFLLRAGATAKDTATAWFLSVGARAPALTPFKECAFVNPQIVLVTQRSGAEARLALALPMTASLRGLVAGVQAAAYDPALRPAVHLSNVMRARFD